MGHDVDAARHLEERHVITERLRWHVAEGSLCFAEHRNGGVHVALLAHVQTTLEREARRVHDRVVMDAVALDCCPSLRDVKRAGTVATLAADTGTQLGVLPFEEGNGLGITGVTRNASIGHQPIESRIVDLVARAEVPAVVAIPGERKLEEPTVFFREVRAGNVSAAHHVVHPLA
jgi:hypothetical protein